MTQQEFHARNSMTNSPLSGTLSSLVWRANRRMCCRFPFVSRSECIAWLPQEPALSLQCPVRPSFCLGYYTLWYLLFLRATSLHSVCVLPQTPRRETSCPCCPESSATQTITRSALVSCLLVPGSCFLCEEQHSISYPKVRDISGQ